MGRLTISVDDKVLERARIRASGQGTSVDAVLCEFLTRYASVSHSQALAAGELLSLSRQSGARRGGHRPGRDALHERR
jgi:hypothetical protein